jgi:hypothetical protein
MVTIVESADGFSQLYIIFIDVNIFIRDIKMPITKSPANTPANKLSIVIERLRSVVTNPDKSVFITEQ